jgi:hypothetical protein
MKFNHAVWKLSPVLIFKMVAATEVDFAGFDLCHWMYNCGPRSSSESLSLIGPLFQKF